MGESHPESPLRLDAIDDAMLSTGLADCLQRVEAPVASLDVIACAHHKAYLSQLQVAHTRAQTEGLVELDSDTAMNAHSLQAALRATGAVLAAIDGVMKGVHHNAFCAVRPPGHHATRDQAMGFCLLNHVAIGALYALAHGAKRVAVLDFDVHHGNGTEDILADHPQALMLGLYQHPFYPPGGARYADRGHLHNVPIPAYSDGLAIRRAIQEEWWPRLREHDPDLILISAGFDGHRDDEMAQWGLVEADYAWITHELVRHFRAGRTSKIVSCLEGGYDPQALGRSVVAHVRELAT
jgi:acetoin utilization deacetylase AcuC-like enzyme